jgi:hypothetical protein
LLLVNDLWRGMRLQNESSLLDFGMTALHARRLLTDAIVPGATEAQRTKLLFVDECQTPSCSRIDGASEDHQSGSAPSALTIDLPFRRWTHPCFAPEGDNPSPVACLCQ